jgi:hypothetical protein
MNALAFQRIATANAHPGIILCVLPNEVSTFIAWVGNKPHSINKEIELTEVKQRQHCSILNSYVYPQPTDLYCTWRTLGINQFALHLQLLALHRLTAVYIITCNISFFETPKCYPKWLMYSKYLHSPFDSKSISLLSTKTSIAKCTILDFILQQLTVR